MEKMIRKINGQIGIDNEVIKLDGITNRPRKNSLTEFLGVNRYISHQVAIKECEGAGFLEKIRASFVTRQVTLYGNRREQYRDADHHSIRPHRLFIKFQVVNPFAPYSHQ